MESGAREVPPTLTVQNDLIWTVQQALNQRGQAGLDTDGVYGQASCHAVMTWQQREHIHVDGIVGPQVRSTLGLPTAVSIPAELAKSDLEALTAAGRAAGVESRDIEHLHSLAQLVTKVAGR